MRSDRSFGVIPLKKVEGEWQVLLIKHQRSHFWGFPKGHADPGETAVETATRELKEETGLEIERLLKEEPLLENYQFRADGIMIDKTVVYYVAEVKEGIVSLQNEEIEDYTWEKLSEAEEKATYDQAKSLCRETLKILL